MAPADFHMTAPAEFVSQRLTTFRWRWRVAQRPGRPFFLYFWMDGFFRCDIFFHTLRIRKSTLHTHTHKHPPPTPRAHTEQRATARECVTRIKC